MGLAKRKASPMLTVDCEPCLSMEKGFCVHSGSQAWCRGEEGRGTGTERGVVKKTNKEEKMREKK